MHLREVDAYARLPIQVVGAEGNELILKDGRRMLDLYGGHCVNTLGAGDPGRENTTPQNAGRASGPSTACTISSQGNAGESDPSGPKTGTRSPSVNGTSKRPGERCTSSW